MANPDLERLAKESWWKRHTPKNPGTNYFPNPIWEQVPPQDQCRWRADIKAILLAIRDPSEAMVECARDVVIVDDALASSFRSTAAEMGKEFSPLHSLSTPEAVATRWRDRQASVWRVMATDVYPPPYKTSTQWPHHRRADAADQFLPAADFDTSDLHARAAERKRAMQENTRQAYGGPPNLCRQALIEQAVRNVGVPTPGAVAHFNDPIMRPWVFGIIIPAIKAEFRRLESASGQDPAQ